MQPRRFSISNLSIKHRLPLLIGTLLLGIVLASTVASYRGVKESALEVGGERLQNLTKQLANLLQQSSALLLTKTFTEANDPAIRAFLRSPSLTTQSRASVMLEQFAAPQDPNSLQVELWDKNRSLVLSLPNGASPVPANLDAEFKACSVDPFKAAGPMQVVNSTSTFPLIAAVKDELGNPIGYLVKWRRPALNPRPKQLTDLLGSEAALYFGNIQGDLLTDAERIVPKPHAELGFTSEVMDYSRDGNRVMGLGRPISGTPWFVLVEFPEQPFLTQANRFLRRIVLIDLVLLAVGIGGAFALSRGITQPLHALTEAASAISGGDYSNPVDVQHRDELGLLAAGFNAMTTRMRTSQSELEENVQALRVSEQRLQTVIENLSEGLVVSDLNGQLLNWNRAALDLHGFASLDECLLKLPEFANIFELADLDGSVLDLEQWPLPRIIRGERLRNFEVRIRRLDSDWNRVFNYGGSIVREASGKFAAVVTMSDITESKRAEERFRLVVEASPSAMLMVNSEGCITLVNTQTETLFGYDRVELLNQPVEMLVPERYRSGHPGHRTGFFRRPSTRAMGAGRDLFGRRKDGTEMPIEIGLNPITTDEGAFVLASIIDITERKRAEERFRLVVEASPSAILMVNSEGLITLVNTQTETLFGYDRAELLEQPMEILVPERYRGGHPGHRSGFFKRPSTRAMGAGRDLYGRRKDGTEMPIEIGLNPITTDEGSFVLASIIDITERKRAEERFRLVVEASPSAILMVNNEGRITLVNTQTETLFGYKRSELLDQPMEILVPERYRGGHPGHRTGFFQHPSTRAMGAGRDLYGSRKDGTEMPIEIGLNPIVTDEGAFVLASIIDITERKRTDAEIHRLNDELELRVIERTTQLEAANKEMEAFSYSASHDLRAPLRHLAGYASLLQKNGASQLDENSRRYVNTIIEESCRMGDLIDHLLNFSRLGRAALQKRPVDLQQLINEVVANTAVPEGHHIRWTISDLPTVSADPSLLRLVFENLLSNAVKFTRKSEEPQVEIGCSSARHQFVLFVKDNGEGFDMRYVDKLFGVFQRLHRTDEFEGTGIGLANVRRIVSRHGGTTWAEGIVGKGATFFITLPRQFRWDLGRVGEPSFVQTKAS
jgi:PAS domain S-box-containing protein